MLGCPIGCGACKQKTNEHEDSNTFFSKVKQTLNSCRSFRYARSNESIIIFNDLCKPIEIHIYSRKKHPFASYPVSDRISNSCTIAIGIPIYFVNASHR